MYWYDAARDRVPTVEQRQIAALPNVKVRLGNLNSAGQQKGVDAQLRQDLELLARHRAVSDVVLIAGDEDMVPAVEAAQAYGVRVHVWGVEPPYGVNQAERLVWEADTVDQLDAEFCRPYVEVEPAAVEAAAVAAAVEAAIEPGPREDKPAVPTPAEVFAARKLAAPPPKPVAAAPVVPALPDRPGPERPEMEQIGARIAARWLLTRGRENVADLLPGPVLPTVIDKELLVEAEEEISRSLRPYEEARRALRDGFWAKLHQEFGIQPASVPPHPTPDHHPATQPPPPIHPAPPASAPSGPAVPAASGPAVPAASGPAAPSRIRPGGSSRIRPGGRSPIRHRRRGAVRLRRPGLPPHRRPGPPRLLRSGARAAGPRRSGGVTPGPAPPRATRARPPRATRPRRPGRLRRRRPGPLGPGRPGHPDCRPGPRRHCRSGPHPGPAATPAGRPGRPGRRPPYSGPARSTRLRWPPSAPAHRLRSTPAPRHRPARVPRRRLRGALCTRTPVNRRRPMATGTAPPGRRPEMPPAMTHRLISRRRGRRPRTPDGPD